MARNTIQKTAPARPTYHLAERLRGRAIDRLYTFTEGLHTLAPIDDLTVTALITAHPWGYSAQLHAVGTDGHIQAAAEATAAHPLPAGIASRIRTFRSGPLTWHHGAARITNTGVDHTSQLVFIAAGRHHYELSRRFDLDTFHQTWDLSIDGHPREQPFAGPVGAADFVVHEYESTT